MSVTVRLSRTGRKNLPSYRVVVSNTKSKRGGKALDILGYFNPSMTPVQFDYDKKKFEEWKSKGALVSDAVLKLIEGKYTYKKYNPKGEAAEAAAASSAPKAEEPASEPATEPKAEEVSEEASA